MRVPVSRSSAALVASLGLVAALAACQDGAPDAGRTPSPTPTASSTPTGTPSSTPTASPTSPTGVGLDWQPTGESPETTVVVGTRWRAVVPADDSAAVLSVDGEQVRVPAGRGYRIAQVLMADDHAVVVAQDDAERRPAKGTVVDLASGDTGPVPGPLPTAGGSWTLHGDELRYPTRGPRRAYCLAAVHLPSAETQIDYCAEKREGFSRVTSSAWGTALMTFDDARPVSCRTLAVLTDGTPVPVEGVPECKGWDVVATESGAVWSALPDEQNVQLGEFSATSDGTVVPLGTGATGTLVPCGDAVFFARSSTGAAPAQLLRWDGEQLRAAWEAQGSGPGFIATPACADDVLTLTYLGEDGDQQVWAKVS